MRIALAGAWPYPAVHIWISGLPGVQLDKQIHHADILYTTENCTWITWILWKGQHTGSICSHNTFFLRIKLALLQNPAKLVLLQAALIKMAHYGISNAEPQYCCTERKKARHVRKTDRR